MVQVRVASEKLQVLAFVAVLMPRRFLDVDSRTPRTKVVDDGVKYVVVRRFW